MVRFAYLVSAWLGLAVLVFAQTTSVTNQLAQYRAVYDAELKKILDESAAKTKSWPDDYLKEIGQVRAKAQKAGDLDGVMAVDAETKRFRVSKDFPDQVVATVPESVRALQLNYRDRPRQIMLERDQKVMEFTGRYRERLATMQSDLTKANKIDGALLVNAEIKRVGACPAVTSAEFALAEEDAKRKKKTDEGSGPVATAPPTPPAPPVAVRTSSEVAVRPPAPPVPKPTAPPEQASAGGLASGFKIVDKPAGLGTVLKSLPMNVTPKLRMPKVRVDITMDEKEPSESGSAGGVYGSYRARSGNTRLVFQTNVRATSSTNEYEGAKMVVQFFTKPASTVSGGRIEPTEAQKIVTPLPKISSQPVYIECPPFQFWSSVTKYRSVYHSSNYKSGDDFFGAIVTVFDDDGKLLFQGTSVNALEKLGVDSP